MDKVIKWCPWHNGGLGQLRPIGEFGPNKQAGTNGLQGQCRECRKARRRAHYAIHGASLQERYSAARASARLRGLRFVLTKAQYAALISQPCEYRIREDATVIVGIDRKDSAKGYTLCNCVPCCHRHNTAKSDVFTHTQMLDAARRYGIECGNVIRVLPRKHRRIPDVATAS